MRTLSFGQLKPGPRVALAALAVIVAAAGVFAVSRRRAPAEVHRAAEDHVGERAAATNVVRVGELAVTDEARELAEIRVAAAETRVVSEKLPVTGTIEAGGDGLVKVTARVQGKVVSLSGVQGDRVRAGQVLGLIESTDLAKAQAEYEHARIGRSLARKNLQRQRKLAALGAFGNPAVEAARKEMNAARGEVSAATGELGAARNQVAEAKSEVAAWEGEVASAEADAAGAQSKLAEAESSLGALQAALSQAETQAQFTLASFKRTERLQQAGISSRQQLEQEQAAHRRALADGDAARANIRQGQAKIESERAAIRATQAKTRAAQARVRQAESAVETAGARKVQAEARLAAAKQQSQVVAGTLAREEAVAKGRYSTSREIVEAEANLQEAEHEMEHSVRAVQLLGGKPGHSATIPLVAPIAGRIQERNASIGETVDTERPLFTILNLDVVWAQLAVAPQDLALVRTGQRVQLVSEAVRGQTFTGAISSIGSTADEKTRTVLVRCVLTNAAGVLRPETFVRGHIITDVRRERVTVPLTALQEHNGKPTLYVAGSGSGGKFEVRHVKLGLKGEGWREVTEGLKAGERVAVHGTFYLKSEALKSQLSDGCCAVETSAS